MSTMDWAATAARTVGRIWLRSRHCSVMGGLASNREVGCASLVTIQREPGVGPPPSRGLKHLQLHADDQLLDARPVFGHVRRLEVGPQRVETFPLLDDDDDVVARRRL